MLSSCKIPHFFYDAISSSLENNLMSNPNLLVVHLLIIFTSLKKLAFYMWKWNNEMGYLSNILKH